MSSYEFTHLQQSRAKSRQYVCRRARIDAAVFVVGFLALVIVLAAKFAWG